MSVIVDVKVTICYSYVVTTSLRVSVVDIQATTCVL